jgi:hypothetical protein
LGRLSRDSGHTRVPDPPHMITGMIFAIVPLDAAGSTVMPSLGPVVKSRKGGQPLGSEG